MGEEEAERTLRAVISLARYAELFAYEQSATFNLEKPGVRGAPVMLRGMDQAALSLLVALCWALSSALNGNGASGWPGSEPMRWWLLVRAPS